MNFYQYFGVAVAASLGFFVGAYVASIAKEELKNGMKYFRILSLFILAIITYISLNIFLNIYISIVISLLLILIILFIKNYRDQIFAAIAAIAYSLTFQYNEFYFIPSLIFIYGLAQGSANYYLTKKGLYQKLALKASLFLIISTVLFFVKITS